MRYTIPLLTGLLALSACGKSDPPPPPTPMPVQTAPAPEPAPTPAPMSGAASAPDSMTAAASAAAPTESAAAPAPASMAAAGGAAAGGSHVVVSGDTLYSIAKAQNVSVDDLMKWNQIDDPRRLFVGKRLMLSAPGK